MKDKQKPQPKIPAVLCGTCIQMKYSHLDTQLLRQMCGIRLWQPGAVQSGPYLNITFDDQAVSFHYIVCRT